MLFSCETANSIAENVLINNLLGCMDTAMKIPLFMIILHNVNI